MSVLYSDIEPCMFDAGPDFIPHSELMRLHSDEGYQLEQAQNMAYDADSVDSYENRFDSFRMDYFDAAEISQKARANAPVVSAVPSSDDAAEQNDVKKVDEESMLDSKAE